MATAAAALELHRQAGRGKKEAANIIAKALSKAGFKKQGSVGKLGGPPEGKTIIAWHLKFAQENGTAGFRWYSGMLRVGAEQNSIEERARGVLQTAVMFVEMRALADMIEW